MPRPKGSKNKPKNINDVAPMVPDGSTVAPERDGNTESLSSHESIRSSKKTWIITLKCNNNTWNGSNGSNLNKWIQTHTENAIWQVERGNEGYLHVQLTLKLKIKNRLSWLKNHFHNTAHCEVVNNIDAAFNYTQKTDTRVSGPFYWPEQVGNGVEDPLENLTLYDWQQEIIDIFMAPVDSRKIYWFWEPNGNVGKSDFCLHCILKHEAVIYDSGKKDILFAHKNATRVIFDLSRTQEGFVSYDAIETLKKGFCFSGKYESGMKVYPKPHIVVFANWEPDTTRLSLDRWVIKKI